ncbi:zf-TFIIB domain-containing protein [Seohaeicola zhoushanensis]
MQCPIDGATLVIAERSGIEIDYCPKCRGVWLDRGELDKIIERAAPVAPNRGMRARSRFRPLTRRSGSRFSATCSTFERVFFRGSHALYL